MRGEWLGENPRLVCAKIMQSLAAVVIDGVTRFEVEIVEGLSRTAVYRCFRLWWLDGGSECNPETLRTDIILFVAL